MAQVASENERPRYVYVDEDSISEDLHCPICFEPCIDPRVHSEQKGESCGQMFCFSCIMDVVKTSESCPFCRRQLTQQSLVFAQRIIVSQLNSLKVKCTICNGPVAREDLQKHQSKCTPPPVRQPECRFELSPKYFRHIVGQEAKQLKAIMNKTGAQIEVPRKGQTSNLIIIKGKTQAQVNQAREIIQEIVRKVDEKAQPQQKNQVEEERRRAEEQALKLEAEAQRRREEEIRRHEEERRRLEEQRILFEAEKKKQLEKIEEERRRVERLKKIEAETKKQREDEIKKHEKERRQLEDQRKRLEEEKKKFEEEKRKTEEARRQLEERLRESEAARIQLEKMKEKERQLLELEAEVQRKKELEKRQAEETRKQAERQKDIEAQKEREKEKERERREAEVLRKRMEEIQLEEERRRKLQQQEKQKEEERKFERERARIEELRRKEIERQRAEAEAEEAKQRAEMEALTFKVSEEEIARLNRHWPELQHGLKRIDPCADCSFEEGPEGMELIIFARGRFLDTAGAFAEDFLADLSEQDGGENDHSVHPILAGLTGVWMYNSRPQETESQKKKTQKWESPD